mgnify:CR=1 FL=1
MLCCNTVSVLMGCTIFVFPFGETSNHLHCRTNGYHWICSTDYITLNVSSYYWALCALFPYSIAYSQDFQPKRVLIFDIVEGTGGARAIGVPYVSVHVLLHRRWKHNCKPLSLKQRTYTHSCPQIRWNTILIHRAYSTFSAKHGLCYISISDTTYLHTTC